MHSYMHNCVVIMLKILIVLWFSCFSCWISNDGGIPFRYIGPVILMMLVSIIAISNTGLALLQSVMHM